VYTDYTGNNLGTYFHQLHKLQLVGSLLLTITGKHIELGAEEKNQASINTGVHVAATGNLEVEIITLHRILNSTMMGRSLTPEQEI
jgi:hypothetical protein